jgi:hypothetical protein
MVLYDRTVVDTVKAGAAATGFPLQNDYATKSIDATWMVGVALSIGLLLWAIWQSKRVAPELEELDRQAQSAD